MGYQKIKDYKAKVLADRAGEPVLLTGGEFLRYFLRKHRLSAEWFDEKIDYAPGSTNRFFRSQQLSGPVADKLAILTSKSATFWRRSYYHPKEADQIWLYGYKDISKIGDMGDTHVQRLQRLREKANAAKKLGEGEDSVVNSQEPTDSWQRLIKLLEQRGSGGVEVSNPETPSPPHSSPPSPAARR